jgi:hypothetical protein
MFRRIFLPKNTPGGLRVTLTSSNANALNPTHVKGPMKAIAYRHCLPSSDPESLIDVELPEPIATGRDLLVRVHAVSVNPVDTKVRRNVPPARR